MESKQARRQGAKRRRKQGNLEMAGLVGNTKNGTKESIIGLAQCSHRRGWEWGWVGAKTATDIDKIQQR